jgi:hypothetical protein
VFKDIITIENVFDNPQEIVELALAQKYYFSGDNPTVTGTKINYMGKRTLPLSMLDEEQHIKITNQILSKLFKDVVRDDCKFNINAQTVCLFHSLTEADRPDNSWCHRDTATFSGVVYLNENFKDRFNNHGTRICRPVRDHHIPYEFNKMVLYRGDYLHSANFGFGQELNESRLTLNFFINDIELKLENENKLTDKTHQFSLS